MSYRAGMAPNMRTLGVEPSDPHVVCDGCGAKRVIRDKQRGAPPKWFRDGKPPPGWRGLRAYDGSKRWDLCPACWKGES